MARSEIPQSAFEKISFVKISLANFFCRREKAFKRAENFFGDINKGEIMLVYDRKKLGQVLKTAREKTDFTQADVSKKLGYTSPQFISNIERGISVAPIPTLAKMVRIYKINPVLVSKVILDSQELKLRKMLGA